MDRFKSIFLFIQYVIMASIFSFMFANNLKGKTIELFEFRSFGSSLGHLMMIVVTLFIILMLIMIAGSVKEGIFRWVYFVFVIISCLIGFFWKVVIAIP